MAKSKKKIDVVGLVAFCVLLVSLALIVTGICIAWTTVKAGSGSLTLSSSSTLGDWLEAQGEGEIDGLNANAAFAYLTLVFAALTLVLFVLTRFLKIKLIRLLTGVSAILLVVCAIVTLITAYTFCNAQGGSFASCSPAAGVWLVFVFGLIGGAAGLIGVRKK